MTFEMWKMSLNDFWPAIDILQDMNQKNAGTLRVSYLVCANMCYFKNF